MNALASFIAYMPVAFVQKILTSLNSTLPQRGQIVSVRILTGTYRSQSAFLIDAIDYLDEIIDRGCSLSDSRQWYPSPAWLSQSRPSYSLDRISYIWLGRHFLIEHRYCSKQGERKHMGSQEQGEVFDEKGDRQGGMIKEINEWDEDKGLRMLSGTYVDPPGADPLGGAPDIRHRKPREIVPQVSADASIKTR
ncbi:hypothetical protein G5I_02180 [Acromyrmex echinatior]|uniref:Uncharacterized protein n=1 Tax=Acromyrmex echinatior TaxID=103372 RepID=F4W9M6_ACREC|nr:hypothetical protein G5I_02180 [Acromyrmex echinatior]